MSGLAEATWPTCECGCGQPAPAAKRTIPSLGHVKGEPRRFINGHQGRGSKTAAERFWAKVERGGPDECWLWTGTGTPEGYGQFTLNSRPYFVHRWVYEQEVGPIPEGLHIDHLCRTRNCVNPTHLEPVTPAENALRGARRASHCKNGHRRIPENLIRTSQGYLRCRICLREVHARRGERAYTEPVPIESLRLKEGDIPDWPTGDQSALTSLDLDVEGPTTEKGN